MACHASYATTCGEYMEEPAQAEDHRYYTRSAGTRLGLVLQF
jgi:hypothetical protein